MGVSSASRPRETGGVAVSPRATSSVAPEGSVPRVAEPKVRQTVFMEFPFTVDSTGVATTRQTVALEFPFSVSSISEGGAFEQTAFVEFPYQVTAASAIAVAQSVPVEFPFQTTASGVFDPATKPMGIDKSGTQQLANNAWTKITGWTPRDGYPDTQLSSDSLVASKAGSYVVKARITFGASGQCALRLKRNGTVVSTVGPSSSASQNISYAVTLAVGDVLSIESAMNNTNAATRVVQAGSAATFLYFDAA